MVERQIDRLHPTVRAGGLGTWPPGALWGDVGADAARSGLETAVAQEVTFFDTADVYGDGRSERFCGGLHRAHPEIFVATKMGRRVEQRAEDLHLHNFL